MASASRWWLLGRPVQPALDPGLQAERTAMSWQRSALGVVGVAALVLRHTGFGGAWAVPGLLAVLVGIALLVAAELRYARIMRRIETGEAVTSRGQVRVAAATTVGLSVIALATVLLHRT